MKKAWSWQREWPFLVLLGLVFFATGVAWFLLPEQIPTHLDSQGVADHFRGRAEYLLMFPGFMLWGYISKVLFPMIDPGRANVAQFEEIYNRVNLDAMFIMAVCIFLKLYAAWHPGFPFFYIVLPLLGVAMARIGNVLGKARPNWLTMGVRTPWTLTSKTAWNKSNRFGGRLFILLGALMVVVVFVPIKYGAWVFFGGSGLIFLSIYIYSFVAWKRDKHRVSPFGTEPVDR